MTTFETPEPSPQPDDSPEPTSSIADNSAVGDSPASGTTNNSALHDEIDQLVSGEYHDPHSILGAHQQPGGPVTIRALRPMATSATAVLADGSRYPMTHLHQGVFEATLPETVTTVPDYRLAVTY